MRIDISGHQMDVTPALRDYVAGKAGADCPSISTTISTPASSCPSTSSTRRPRPRCTPPGKTIYADATAPDMYAAIDLLTDKLDRLVLKQKEKMKDHHRGESAGRWTASAKIGSHSPERPYAHTSISARELFDQLQTRLRAALAGRPARRGPSARAQRSTSDPPAVAGGLSECHPSQQGADPRHRGTGLARPLDARQRWENTRARSSDVAPAGPGDQPRTRPARPTCAGLRGIRHAAVGVRPPRLRIAQPAAVPPGQPPGAATHAARRVHGNLFDRRTDHRRLRRRQERTGAWS